MTHPSVGSGLSPRGTPSYNFDDNFDLNPEPPCSAELGPVIEKCKQDPNNIPRGHFINAVEDGGSGSKKRKFDTFDWRGYISRNHGPNVRYYDRLTRCWGWASDVRQG